MIIFRDKNPTRRNVTKKVTNWGDHKPDLKIDFNNHCAYCHSFDGFRHTWFEVDHFIPRNFFESRGNIQNTEYSNLVYSCKFCNNNKHSKWPSQSERDFNNGTEGFIEPCSIEYSNQFFRDSTGAIMWRTPLGKWMHTVAFKFDERERGIRLLWNLERLKDLIKKLKIILDRMDPGSEPYIKLKPLLLQLTLEYYEYDDELMNYYDSL